jgi:hypothetical protein
MVFVHGRWLIERSNIAPHGCPAAARPHPKPSGGSTLYVHDFNGNKLGTSATIFGNPATPANQFETAPRGSRLVAIQLRLTGEGPGTVDSDANSDATLIGTDGQAYTPTFDDIQGCTNFSYGEFTLGRGQSEVGCVVFAVPNGVGINRVTFSLTDGSVDTVQWTG